MIQFIENAVYIWKIVNIVGANMYAYHAMKIMDYIMIISLV